MQKINYNKKICKCGHSLKVNRFFKGIFNYAILRCNNPECLQKYYILKDKLNNKLKSNPEVL